MKKHISQTTFPPRTLSPFSFPSFPSHLGQSHALATPLWCIFAPSSFLGGFRRGQNGPATSLSISLPRSVCLARDEVHQASSSGAAGSKGLARKLCGCRSIQTYPCSPFLPPDSHLPSDRPSRSIPFATRVSVVVKSLSFASSMPPTAPIVYPHQIPALAKAHARMPSSASSASSSSAATGWRLLAVASVLSIWIGTYT